MQAQPERVAIAPDPIDSAVAEVLSDAIAETSADGSGEVSAADAFVDWPIEEDAAATAIGRLSPTVS